MKKRYLLSIISTTLLFPIQAQAFDFSNVILWAGTGSNEAVFVIDFKQAPAPASYAWGYRWSGTKTAADMLLAIDALDANLTVTTQLFGSSVFVDNITYNSPTTGTTFTGAPFPAGYFNTFGGGTGGSPSWISASVGLSDTLLINHDWQGASWVSGPNFDVMAPSTPIAAVAEPASILALSMAALGMISKKRRNRV